MSRLRCLCAAAALALLTQPAGAEAVYEFVTHCRQEALADCFHRIRQRLHRLNAGNARRICLPRTYPRTRLESGVLPVSLLEHVRMRLSAARFGQAGASADDVMARIINGIYPCDEARNRNQR